MPNRRRHVRLIKTFQAWWRPTGKSVFQDRCLASNLSLQGACVVSRKALAPGDRYDLIVRLGGEYLTMTTRVIWCRPQGSRFEVGLRFDLPQVKIGRYLERDPRFCWQKRVGPPTLATSLSSFLGMTDGCSQIA